MPYHRESPEQHRGCRAQVGELHEQGCDVEICVRCGRQAITCDCVYEVNGINPDTLETTHPDLYVNGATDAMYAVLDTVIAEFGGRLPRTRSYPGVEECEQLGWFCVFEPYGDPAWKPAKRDDPGDIQADLNRFARVAVWDPWRRLYIVRGRALPVRGWAIASAFSDGDVFSEM